MKYQTINKSIRSLINIITKFNTNNNIYILSNTIFIKVLLLYCKNLVILVRLLVRSSPTL